MHACQATKGPSNTGKVPEWGDLIKEPDAAVAVLTFALGKADGHCIEVLKSPPSKWGLCLDSARASPLNQHTCSPHCQLSLRHQLGLSTFTCLDSNFIDNKASPSFRNIADLI